MWEVVIYESHDLYIIYSAELNSSFSLLTISNIYYEMCQWSGHFWFLLEDYSKPDIQSTSYYV